MPYTTRIAPSPTGLFHIGTARTAYINYLAAKSSGGKFILRIDDTDVERNKEEYTQIILDSLDWLGLEPDEVYYQSNRTEIYKKTAYWLLGTNRAKELDNGAIALLWPETMPTSFEDTISGTIPITETNKAQIHEKTILLRGCKEIDPKCVNGHDLCRFGPGPDCPYCEKADCSKLGQPTYQFSSAIDDYFMEVNWIIRGVDHITNTPKQIAIWCNLLVSIFNGIDDYPKFTHLGLIKYNGKKLSKRDNAASLLEYKKQGYTPAAMLNFLLRLGWSPKGDGKEHKFIDKERAIELFTQGNLSNRPAIYELHKLEAFRRHYG